MAFLTSHKDSFRLRILVSCIALLYFLKNVSDKTIHKYKLKYPEIFLGKLKMLGSTHIHGAPPEEKKKKSHSCRDKKVVSEQVR